MFTRRFLRLLREGFWVVLGQIAAVIGSLIGVRVLTGLLEPSDYGQLALGLTAAMLVQQTITGPLANGITRFFALAQEQGELAVYFRAVSQIILAATAVILLGAFAATAALILSGYGRWAALVVAAMIFAVLSGWNSMLDGIQSAARQRAVVALHQGLEAWAKFGVAAALLILVGPTSLMALVGYGLAVIMVLISQYLFLRRIRPAIMTGTTLFGEWKQRILEFSWPFLSWGVLAWMQLASDRWALELFRTTDDVGLYAVLFRLGYYPVLLMSGMIVRFVAPILYQRVGDASDDTRKAMGKRISVALASLALVLTALAVVLALAFHTPIFDLLTGKEYGSVSYLLPWVLLGSGLFATGQVLTLDFMSSMRTRRLIGAKVITALVGIALNFAGAYWYGLEGVVAAGVVFSLLYALWMVVLFRKASERSVQARP